MKPSAEQLNELTSRSPASLLWQYCLPAVVGMVVMSVYNIIDRIVIGQVVGPNAIAGLAITFPVTNLATAIGVLVGMGAAARTSILLGEGDKERASLVLGNALVLTIVNALVYLTLFWVFLDDLLYAFGASEATIPYARDFMLWILPGMLMINLAFGFNNIMRASGYPTRAMFTMIIGAGVNIVLAPLFVYFLDLGIKGAAIATDISMTISMLFVMSHFCRRSANLHFKRGIYRLHWKIIWEMISIGAAPSILNVTGCLINVVLNYSLYHYGGDMAIAVGSILGTYASFIGTIILGLCQGMQPIVGYNYGARRPDRIRQTFLLVLGASTAICLIGCLGGVFMPGLMARAFTTDAALIALAEECIPIAQMAFFLVGLQIVSATFFESIGQAGRSIFLSLTRQTIFLVPLLLILPHFFGLMGIFASFSVSDILATFVAALLLALEFRTLKKMTPENA